MYDDEMRSCYGGENSIDQRTKGCAIPEILEREVELGAFEDLRPMYNFRMEETGNAIVRDGHRWAYWSDDMD